VPAPAIRSRKQLIRLWFDFYKHALDDQALQPNLAASADFYEPWGDCRGILFDLWWNDHKRLFGATEVAEITRASNYPNVLNVSIPLNLPVTQALPAIRALILKKQRARLIELGIDPSTVKSMQTGFGTYELTKGEIRGRTLSDIYLVFSIWRSLKEPPVNSALCQTIVETLRSSPEADSVPHILRAAPSADRKGIIRFSEDQIRQLRRYIDKGKRVCISVSKGEFPGNTSL
jgi:hypothetical protein